MERVVMGENEAYAAVGGVEMEENEAYAVSKAVCSINPLEASDAVEPTYQ